MMMMWRGFRVRRAGREGRVKIEGVVKGRGGRVKREGRERIGIRVNNKTDYRRHTVDVDIL